MWWWWNKRYTRCWKSCLSNPRIYLLTRKMSALTRLCTLRHLNLYFFCTYKVLRCNTKSSWSYLLNCRTSVKSVSSDCESVIIFTAFTTIWLTMYHIHSNRHSFVCFLWNRTVRHSTCLKSLNNRVYTFYFINVNTFFRELNIHKSS